MSNYWVFGANQSINSYFAAILRHQGWFPYFSTGPVGRHAGKKGYSANPSGLGRSGQIQYVVVG